MENPLNNTKNLLNYTKRLLVLVSLLLVFVSGLCFGQQKEIKLFVSPEIFELEVKRGQILEDKIKIYNKGGVSVPIGVSVTNFGAQEESGTITFYEKPTPKEPAEVGPPQVEGGDDISYNPRKWIKIENPNFILDAGETEEVKFSVAIPENAEPGGHYAVALFEPKLPSYYFEKGTVRAIPKIGVLFLFSVEVEGLTKPEELLTVVEFAIPEKLHLRKLEDFFVKIVKATEEEKFIIVETCHLPFILSIKNNDIYHIKPEGKLEIFRIPLTNANHKLTDTKKTVGETEIKETTILPGKTRKFPVEFKPNLPKVLEKYLPASILEFISQNMLFGKYRALLDLKVGNDTINKEIEFWVFPWKVVLFTSFVAFIFLIFLIKYRKRIKLAIGVLVKK